MPQPPSLGFRVNSSTEVNSRPCRRVRQEWQVRVSNLGRRSLPQGLQGRLRGLTSPGVGMVGGRRASAWTGPPEGLAPTVGWGPTQPDPPSSPAGSPALLPRRSQPATAPPSPFPRPRRGSAPGAAPAAGGGAAPATRAAAAGPAHGSARRCRSSSASGKSRGPAQEEKEEPGGFPPRRCAPSGRSLPCGK